MVALSTERNTRARIGDLRVEPMAASVKIWGGSLVMRNAAGYLTKGATATGCVGVGRAEKTVDNTGAAGAASVEYRIGLFLFRECGARRRHRAGVSFGVKATRARPSTMSRRARGKGGLSRGSATVGSLPV